MPRSTRCRAWISTSSRNTKFGSSWSRFVCPRARPPPSQLRPRRSASSPTTPPAPTEVHVGRLGQASASVDYLFRVKKRGWPYTVKVFEGSEHARPRDDSSTVTTCHRSKFSLATSCRGPSTRLSVDDDHTMINVFAVDRLRPVHGEDHRERDILDRYGAGTGPFPEPWQIDRRSR